MKHLLFCLSIAAISVLTGCAGIDEELYPADITLSKLEAAIEKATDPEGHYARSNTAIMRQEISDSSNGGLFGSKKMRMVEVKTMKPDFFRLTTYEENEPVLALISNGRSCWVADYKKRRVKTLSDREFEKMRILSEIARPGSKLHEIFKNINIQRSIIDGEEYYKLTCSNPGDNPLEIYISRNTFLTTRIRGAVKTAGISDLQYDSTLTGHSLHNGVRIPEETTSSLGGETQQSRVIYYRLNENIDPSEFRPPVF